METPMKMDDLGVPLFLETPMLQHVEFALAHEEDFLDCAEQLEKAQGVRNLDEWRFSLGE